VWSGDVGRPGTLGATLVRPALGYVDIGPYYCAFKAVGRRSGSAD
jgi:hypothetical protein